MTTIQFSAKSTMIRAFLRPFQPWIEQQLGTSLADAVQLRLEGRISPVAATRLLGQSKCSLAGIFDPLGKQLTGVELPPGVIPAMSMRLAHASGALFTSGKKQWHVDWLDCPAALYLEGFAWPVVVANIPLVVGDASQEWREVVILRRDAAASFLDFVERVFSDDGEIRLRTHHGPSQNVRRTSWEELVLEAETARLLKDDFESFFEREPWFRQHNLPFRRGYLLYGPPGNGKTSAIRAMLSHSGVTGHSIDLFGKDVDNDELTNFFSASAATAPAIMILEDLDRLFDRKAEGERRPNITLQHLLNCIDGVTTQDGVVIVATANKPHVLAAAILRRPGRLDRVVHFANPNVDLRMTYLRKLLPEMKPIENAAAAQATDGFSFAQLREAYILAGQFAFARDGRIRTDDLMQAIQSLKKSLQEADWKGEGPSGFRV